ncbi:MAG TPA: glycoside hydrolase family 3 N-terminal domain-containing protein [Solirubrobacteraceae bacterium]
MSAQRRGDGPPRPETIRRRRRIAGALGGLIVLALGFGLALAVFGGSSHHSPRFVPAGPPVASVITPSTPATPLRRGAAPAFTPLPAAVSRAASLTLAQQVAQLFLVSVPGHSAAEAGKLGSAGWGGFVLGRDNFAGDHAVAALTGAITAAARAANLVAPLIAATQEGGPDTAFPDLPPQGEASIGATGPAQLAGSQAQLAGQRLRALGVTMTLAPLADVDTTAGALSGRLFSTDPAAVASFTAAAVSGYARAGVISAVGHFPGSGGASADPDQMTATVGGSLNELRSRDLIPFAAVAATAPVMVMSNAAYVAFDGVTPASLLPQAVNLLRQGLGYAGVVMSDDLDATIQPTSSDPGTVAVEALRAGDDLLYITGPPSESQAAYTAVLIAARSNSAVRILVHNALLRVLTLKARYGLLGQ